MRILYRTTGRAAEYAPFSANLYTTCPHACAYCYVPSTPPCRMHGITAADFRAPPQLKPGAIAQLYKDLKRHKSGSGRVLLSFGCDCYAAGPDGRRPEATRHALTALAIGGADVAVLTKGGLQAEHDFDLMALHGVWFGQTIVFTDDDAMSHPDCEHCPNQDGVCFDDTDCPMTGWEPYAAGFADREAALQIAHDMGIRTWVSLEPVISTAQALEVIDRLLPWVDHWKIGKLNGRKQEHKRIEQAQNWPQFLAEARRRLSSYIETHAPGEFRRNTFYVKRGLLKDAGEL